MAYRIVDFSAGVVFGVRGSIERVTPRVFLLSPAQVNIKVEEPEDKGPAHDLFADGLSRVAQSKHKSDDYAPH